MPLFCFQMLLHDQYDLPLMKDLGFAVAPGTHSLVGVKQTQVKSDNEPIQYICSHIP